MKSAKEMFEDLGYEYSFDNRRDEFVIHYWKDQDTLDWKHICFYEHTYEADEKWESMSVDMPTFKAIKKQCEELGWLDE